jgi:chromosome partitioning protein
MNMKIGAVVNPKGGIGKSAVSANIGHAAIEKSLRTLLVDFDKQGSLSLAYPSASGCQSSKEYLKASDLFGEPESVVEKELEYLAPGVAIIRADFDGLSRFESAPDEFIKRPARNLRRFAEEFDVAVVDTPGVIGMSLKAALTAADGVVCPLTVGLYDTAGLAALWKIIGAIKKGGYNPKLRVLGMIPSRLQSRDKMAMAELSQLRAHPVFGPMILPFNLYERVPVARAINLRLPVWKGARSASHRAAGAEWKNACGHVLTSLEG